MSDKIKELREKRDAAMDWREKSNIFNEIDEQLKQALREEAEQ